MADIDTPYLVRRCAPPRTVTNFAGQRVWVQWKRLLNRPLVVLRRRQRAAKLGLRFTRARDFHIPSQMVLGGRAIALSLPEQSGVRTAFIDILLDDCYGLNSMTAASTILDIGANVGLFGLAARHSFPTATVHAYEPNSALEAYLQVQAASAGFKYFLEAVGTEAGRVTLDDLEDSVQNRTHSDPSGPIPQIAFRTAVKRLGGSVGLAKLDCEGAEWDLLREAGSWRGVERIAMEYHLWSGHTHNEARMRVSSLGFTIVEQQDQIDTGLLLARR